MNVQVKTTVNVYNDEPLVYFSIEYTNGLTNASIPDVSDHTLSSFPSFVLEETDMKRASLTWARGSKHIVFRLSISCCLTISLHMYTHLT